MVVGEIAINQDYPYGYLQVYYLGEGEESKQWLQQEENTIEKLCLAHMKAVANYVVSAHPTVKPVVWDDMLRGMSEETLRGRSKQGFIYSATSYRKQGKCNLKDALKLREVSSFRCDK